MEIALLQLPFWRMLSCPLVLYSSCPLGLYSRLKYIWYLFSYNWPRNWTDSILLNLVAATRGFRLFLGQCIVGCSNITRLIVQLHHPPFQPVGHWRPIDSGLVLLHRHLQYVFLHDCGAHLTHASMDFLVYIPVHTTQDMSSQCYNELELTLYTVQSTKHYRQMGAWLNIFVET